VVRKGEFEERYGCLLVVKGDGGDGRIAGDGGIYEEVKGERKREMV